MAYVDFVNEDNYDEMEKNEQVSIWRGLEQRLV